MCGKVGWMRGGRGKRRWRGKGGWTAMDRGRKRVLK